MLEVKRSSLFVFHEYRTVIDCYDNYHCLHCRSCCHGYVNV